MIEPRRRSGPTSAAAPPRLPRGAGVNTFPTSFAQERLWVLEQIAPGRAAANVAGAFRVTGRLDRAVLRRSLCALALRHESLRTTFASVAAVPLQVVSPFAAVSLPIADRHGGPETAADALAAVVREMDRPFEVAHGPLVRFTSFPLTDDAHVCCLALHHLIADAWSMPVLVRELAVLYRAFATGRAAALPDVRLHYADYAVAQRERFGDHRHTARLVAYWRRALAAAPYLPVGTGDRLDTPPATLVRRIAPAVVDAARAVSRRERVTLFVTALACWQLVLARWTGCDDVTVLSPFANRDAAATADAVGFFVNPVALRTRLDGDPSFRALLHHVRDVVRNAQRHQALPFERVLAALGVERTLTRPPLSPVGFGFEQADLRRIVLPDAEVVPLELERATGRTDLALVLRDAGHRLTARLEYSAGALDAETAAGLLKTFTATLARAATEPDRRLSALHSPPPVRAVGVPEPRADSPAAVPATLANATVWERFAARAAAAPDAIAVRLGATTTSYGELARRAAAVAAALAERGIAPGTLVGVWGERGAWLVAAMLGIFRAGAVYLPLDPLWPAARLTRVLRQSAAPIVLADTPSPATLRLTPTEPASAGWELAAVAVDGAADATSLPPAPAPRDLAYVVYTSGSTGAPKGAMIEHAGLLNHLEAKRALLTLGAGDRVAQSAATGFDVSLWQCLAPLLAGGEVVVVPDAVARDPERLLAAVAADGITVLEVVPAMLRALLDVEGVAGPNAFATLRWLVVTGEQLAPALCRTWLHRHPRIPLVNAYGPTECADDVTHHVVRTPPAADAARVPIGSAIPNVRVHVLDEHLRPVADGDVGELCVSGIAVGRGYWADPARTGTAFVPDPFGDGDPGRLYRTGDLGRRLPDGTLECLGRRDHQVKVRGMRVEPEEIEAALVEHGDVRAAAVVPWVDASDDVRLVAYVVPSESRELPAAALRAFVAARLPSAMVPSWFVSLSALPCDANGKVDRRSLAARAPASGADGSAPRPPATAIERTLVDVWAAVLAIAPPSVEDNFFALGGDSLASIQVAARARRHGIVLRPQDVFAHQTIARLAAVATVGAAPHAEQDLVVGDVPLTPIQRLFFAAELGDLHHYNLAVLVETPADVDPDLIAVAVEHLLRHHDVLRARFRRDEGEWRQSFAGVDGPVPFATVDLSAVPDARLATAIADAADRVQASLDVEAGPLVRAEYLHLGAGRSGRLLLVVHHLACDVVSLPFLCEDLARLYAQLSRGDAIALPAKTSSMRAWAERLVDYARSAAHADALEYWQRECDAGARLPGAAARRAPVVADVERVGLALGAVETSALVALAARHDASLEAVLLTALVSAVLAAAGGDGVPVYVEHHGRAPLFPEVDVSRTVGWFTAVFPLRLRAAPSGRPLDTLALVAARLRDVPDGGIGFGVLRSGMRDARTAAALAALPQPEISLNYLGRLDPPADVRWRPARESAGRDVGVRGTRPTRVDVTAHVADGRLHVDWAYDARSLARGFVERLAAEFAGVLGALADERDRPLAAAAATAEAP